MPTTARDFKRLAELDASQASTEPRRRSVISRAYYAAYHRCLRWESELPVKSTHKVRGGVHRQLIGRLECPDPRCGAALKKRSEDLAELLDEQLERRRQADYELRDAVDRTAMDLQLKDTRRVFEKCAEPER